MIGYEIESILNRADWRVKGVFRGVFSKDTLPKYLPSGQAHALVCNLSHSKHPGTHWVAIYISPFGDLTYFDSFGRAPDVTEIDIFINNHARTVTYNRLPIQGSITRTCGLYCIYFIIKRCEGFGLTKILSIFHPFKPEVNDSLIIKYVL